MIVDGLGRIKQLDKKDNLRSGYSGCNKCEKDMPICWDIVCYKCNHTFCYNCSINFGDFWYCEECAVSVYNIDRF